jgi:hypothetical protein
MEGIHNVHRTALERRAYIRPGKGQQGERGEGRGEGEERRGGLEGKEEERSRTEFRLEGVEVLCT